MVRSTARFRIGRTAGSRLAAGLAALVLVGTGVSAPASGAAGATTVATERLVGADQYAVSVAISQRLAPHGAPVVYLVSGTAFGEALAVGPAAAHDGGAILYTGASSMPAVVAAELVRLAPARVEAVGGTAAIADAVLTQARALLDPAAVVERISGPDRYGTAAAVSARTFAAGKGGTVLVASGEDFPDAVAAAPAAAMSGAPLLLVSHDYLPAKTATELVRLKPTRVIVVGSTASVSAAVLTAIDALVPTVERVAGADRYAVARAVADRFFPHATTVAAASGATYTDGLAVGPLAAARAAPILYLQAGDQLPIATRGELIARKPTRIVIAGSVAEIIRAELVGFSDGRLKVPTETATYPAYDSGYHDPGEMLTLIKATEIAYPTLVHVFSIGKSYQGRDIWAAKISDNVSVDENEPEVLVDTLYHADEHLGVEQALYLLGVLTSQYATDPTVHRLVNEREIWIVFNVNPDGWAYDLSGGKYHFWRKNRQPNPGWADPGTDLNRNYGYKWSCCNGSSAKPYDWDYRGSAPFSAPETKVLADFVKSRVIGGKQQIRTHVTLHTNGELVLYPYGYTKSGATSDMTADDHLVFVKMAQTMATMNGYSYRQSSHLYTTDGDEIDYLYHSYRIFSFTMELYPVEMGNLTSDVYPPYTVVAKQTARNRGALLYLIDMAGCPYAAIGKAAKYCGGAQVSRPSGGLLP